MVERCTRVSSAFMDIIIWALLVKSCCGWHLKIGNGSNTHAMAVLKPESVQVVWLVNHLSSLLWSVRAVLVFGLAWHGQTVYMICPSACVMGSGYPRLGLSPSLLQLIFSISSGISRWGFYITYIFLLSTWVKHSISKLPCVRMNEVYKLCSIGGDFTLAI